MKSNQILPIRSIGLMVSTLLLMAILADCHRKESPKESTDKGAVLSQEDLTFVGLFPQVDSARVARAIGRPDSMEVILPSNRFPHGGYSVWHYRDYEVYFNSNKTLAALKLLRSGPMTFRGLQVGDSLNRVRELYGRSKDDLDLPFEGLSYRSAETDTIGMFVQVYGGVVAFIYVGRLF